VTIAAVRLRSFAIPLRRPLATAYGTIERRRGVLVEIIDGEGRRGLGEATPHPAAAPAVLGAVRDDLRSAVQWLTGADPSRLEDLLRAVSRLRAPAAMAIDMALHDLVGVASGRAVVDLLGGARRAVVRASTLLTDDDDTACAAAARDALANGFIAAKTKIGPGIDGAVSRVAAIRRAAPALALRCDANGAWDGGTATAVARRLAPLDVAWLEQPVAGDDLSGLDQVRRCGGVAVAADEAVTGAGAIPCLAGAADVAVVKLVQVGGLAAARATAASAAAHGMRVTVTTGLEAGIARTAALHLAAALPAPLEDCGLATGSLLAGDLLRDAPGDGPLMSLPALPGLGVELDPEAVARWCLE
jgi:L-alanine-DL-glutamate epimerase-like enolase superfamily enzyme